MNYRFVINQLGLLLIVLAAILLGVAVWELIEYVLRDQSGEGVALSALLASGGIGLCVGGGLWFAGRSQKKAVVGRREALLLVACSWIFGAALGALPFYLWASFPGSAGPDHTFASYVNCYFEATSGLTTTGATVLGDIESMPRGLLLWRALMHWLGGLGIVVLFVAVLPSLGVGGKKLFHTEAPGPAPSGVRPRIAETARVLWLIYLGLTLSEIVALRVCGMSWFDAICHTFATVSTGGFSTRDASVGAYGTGATIVIIIYMVLAGVNFGLYYQLLRGSVGALWRDTELRFYLGMIGVGAVVIVVSLMVMGDPMASTEAVLGPDGEPLVATRVESFTDEFGHTTLVSTEAVVRKPIPVDLGHAVEYGLFNSVSIHTGTGFCTIDYNRWPFAAKATLWLLMIIGGCAGSTTGGIKVARVWITVKILFAELHRAFRPNVVRPLRFGRVTIDPDLKLQIITYAVAFMLVWVAGSFLLMLMESGHPRCDYTTAASASLATLGNIGPGFNAVGAVENYGWMTAPSKALLSLLMVLGRLEMFAIIVLFLPGFWRDR